MSTRQEKVNSLLQQEISKYLIEEKLEGITGLLTVTLVEVTPDLKFAKVYVSCLGQDAEEVLEILKKHIYEIQGVVYQKLAMKIIPRISFAADHSGEYAGRISKVIRDLHPPKFSGEGENDGDNDNENLGG